MDPLESNDWTDGLIVGNCKDLAGNQIYFHRTLLISGLDRSLPSFVEAPLQLQGKPPFNFPKKGFVKGEKRLWKWCWLLYFIITGSSFLSLSLFLLLLGLLSEADSPLSVFVLAKITSAAVSLRSLAGPHTWLVHALLARHLES